MCGRFFLDADLDTLVEHFQVARLEFAPSDYRPRYNIAPTQDAPVVRHAPEGRSLALLRWGLVPFWADDVKTGYRMINARAERVAQAPAYRHAFRRRRCLVPASGFYEWRPGPRGKQPYAIVPADAPLFAFAGLWERRDKGETPVESFTIVVTDANAALRPIHERMPVILQREDYDAWLDPTTPLARLQALLHPIEDTAVRAYPVSRRVNDPRHDDPDLVRPLA